MKETQIFRNELKTLSDLQVLEGLRFNGSRANLPSPVGVTHANLACAYKNEALNRRLV